MALALSTVLPAAAIANTGQSAGTRSCDRPDPGTMPAAPKDADPESLTPGTEWLLADRPQAALEAVQERVAASGAEAEMLGSYIDWNARNVVLVLDPKASVETRQAVAESIASEPEAPVTTAEGCSERRSLDRVMSLMANSESLRGVKRGWWLDPRAGNVRLSITPTDAARGVSERIKREAGPLLQVIVEARPTLVADNRFGSNAPHWGGAWIENCTSGATLRITHNGARRVFMITAAHCGTNGDRFDSGSSYFGYGNHNTWNEGLPGDLMLVGATGDPYTDWLHTDPGSPTSRNYVAPHVMNTGHGACLSGSRTRAVCGAAFARYENFDDGFGAYRVAVVYKTGAVIAQPGDSGGPVYGRTGTNEADYRGVITAVNCRDATGNTAPCGTAFIQMPDLILHVYAHLNPEFAF